MVAVVESETLMLDVIVERVSQVVGDKLGEGFTQVGLEEG